MGWRGVLWLGLGLLAACGGDPLPSEIVLEHVVRELAPPLASGAAIEGAPADAVRHALVQPGDRAGGGARRDALVVPGAASIRLRLEVPDEAVLRFSAGVEGERRRDTSLGGVGFRVTVDGSELFDRVVNPASRRKDRRWIDGRIDLGPWAGQSVDLVLETYAANPDRPLAGTPAWSHVRLLREERVPRQGAAVRPNVLVILVDTLRADMLGVYGATPSPSPALDAFAATGLIWDVAVSQASWTMPAVASIFTGLHPRSHGAVGPDAHDAQGQSGTGSTLPDDVVTIAELAQRAGITTVGVSGNLLVSPATNLAQGFESFVELPFDKRIRDYASASAVNREFFAWLGQAGDVRFFAYLHYMEPHGPYAPPAESRPPAPPGIRADLAAGWVQDFARAVNEGRARPPSPAEVEYLRRLYEGDIRSWDAQLATLLSGLAERGVLDDTIVIVTADHGEEFLEHGQLTHGGHLYEETVRIPLIVAGPGIPRGRRSDVAQGIDLLPTIAARLGVDVPPQVPGRDLIATHTNGDVVSEIVAGFGDDGIGRGTVALRTAGWKLIRPPDLDVELYDLTSDPTERHNLAAASTEAGPLTARLERWAAAAPPSPRTAKADPGIAAKLRQLGYVE